jgi:GntR family transcriptional regulator
MFRAETFENNKLPSESMLAETLGISLVTLRESLLMLALEGYITKRHGAGNYVHASTLEFENRSIFFSECLMKDGYSTGIRVISQKILPASREVAEALSIGADDLVLQNRVIHTADDHPAIYTILTIPMALLVNTSTETMDFRYLHELIWKYCRKNLAHSLNEYVPTSPPSEIAKIFSLPEGTPIIASKQVFYDTYDIPVIYSYNYFYPNLYKVRTLQNWALNPSS